MYIVEKAKNASKKFKIIVESDFTVLFTENNPVNSYSFPIDADNYYSIVATKLNV